jgi:chromosome segregation ATPase
LNLVTFSMITIALLATTAGVCFSLGWTARRVSTSGREDELKRNVYEAKGAIPQLESTLRNRDQRINMLQTESQALRDRLTQAEAAVAQKDAEIVKRDREVRLARSELQIVKDGSIGLDPDIVEGADADAAPAGSDPKVAIEMKRLEARYESLKKGLVQRDDRIAELEQKLQGGPGKRSTQILEEEITDLQAAAELAQATLAARDATIQDLQTRLQQDVEQRELLETLTKRRGDANRTLKESYTKLEAQLPKLMDQLSARGDTIAEREASIALLDADLAHVRSEKAEREATIVDLDAKLAAGREQIAQYIANQQTQKQHSHQLEQRIDMLTHEVAETTKALQASHALVRERDAALEVKDARLSTIDEKLREQSNTVASMQKLLKDRDFKIDSMTADLAGAEAKAAAAREEVAKQLAQNQALQRSLSKWEQRVSVLTAALADSGTAAQAATQVQTQQHAAAEERDTQLRDNEAKLQEHEQTIAQLRSALSAREGEVETLTADIAALRTQRHDVEAVPPITLAPTVASADDASPRVSDEHAAAANLRAERTERELNANARELKTLKTQLAELETRCASLDGLLRGKDATLTERARRIEDLQDQLVRLEARIDERNQQITDLKRARDEAPAPSPYAAARATHAYNPQSKPL